MVHESRIPNPKSSFSLSTNGRALSTFVRERKTTLGTKVDLNFGVIQVGFVKISIT